VSAPRQANVASQMASSATPTPGNGSRGNLQIGPEIGVQPPQLDRLAVGLKACHLSQQPLQVCRRSGRSSWPGQLHSSSGPRADTAPRPVCPAGAAGAVWRSSRRSWLVPVARRRQGGSAQGPHGLAQPEHARVLAEDESRMCAAVASGPGSAADSGLGHIPGKAGRQGADLRRPAGRRRGGRQQRNALDQVHGAADV